MAVPVSAPLQGCARKTTLSREISALLEKAPEEDVDGIPRVRSFTSILSATPAGMEPPRS